MVKIHKSNEAPELVLRLRLWKFPNSVHFVWERGDTVLVNVVSKKFQTGHALVGFDNHTVGREAFKNSLQVLEVLIVGGVGNENIVYVCVGWWYPMENLVYKSLEYLGSVPEVKGHLDKFKQSEGGRNRSLGYIRWGHRNLVVGTY